ncbi:MAG: hypothetical protein AAFQ79_10330 [Pseudomonadota bacterium]
MTPEDVQAHFTRSDGTYRFARWGRPIAPVVFGVEPETLPIVKGAFEAVAVLANHQMAETDPELGINVMMFFFRDWRELTDTPNLDRLIPDLGPLVDRLIAAEANQYRIFRFDDGGAIKACFIFIGMDEHMSQVPAETLALSQVVQSILMWSDTAFTQTSPLAVVPETGTTILRPEIAGLIRAAYDPVLPVAADDPSHALRIYARMGPVQ